MKLGFVVRHYAGEVSYDGGGFVDKNKDRCPEDLLVLLRNSSSSFVAMLVGGNTPAPAAGAASKAAKGGQVRGGRNAKFMGVVSKFQEQLGEL